jgi:hypothetical protein
VTTSAIMILVAVVAVIFVVVASRRSGPRVTTIETRRETDEGEKDA